MIKTSYEIKIKLNDNEFELTINEPNAKERKLLELKRQAGQKDLDRFEAQKVAYEESLRQISHKQEMVTLNLELSKELKGDELVALLKETKELKNQIYAISTTLKEPDFKPLEAGLEDILRYKSELLISGAKKDEFLKSIDELSISYKFLWDEIAKKVGVESQKKP
ncbi:TPA: hypothetical protein RPW15_001673 [Campylobacter fetus subsp. venerealis]|uniref:Uncharacterized protein n=1 Tax=Campylobacter fetus subsp. venerealis NCTC 10354 TaxID=983328 RepID=A0AAE6IY38_CAMFE|nr:hypothetical protein [Campylobacter fetus]OCS25434.1 hypothetical protein CFVB10_08535 [Campylobacter fetus subsp. venerealis cfvB10]OCS29089.1 hypothetical protein CFVCCUG33900_08285 [Campylobacter fetus subsp. venerealis LMG 6570 = CCUG 33900]AIR80140.1 hypothetical protein CFV97608_0477 [Campylobacter fetus subsp. venerealis 97/608]EAK0836133.1 hypothetical protein [Campylobacter fetus]EGU23664.1 Hypothetical protein CFV354_0580 [Campylobacter fetus subsp. venerealis NCTC 10354]